MGKGKAHTRTAHYAAYKAGNTCKQRKLKRVLQSSGLVAATAYAKKYSLPTPVAKKKHIV